MIPRKGKPPLSATDASLPRHAAGSLAPHRAGRRALDGAEALGEAVAELKAVNLTRTMIALWYHWMRPKTLPF